MSLRLIALLLTVVFFGGAPFAYGQTAQPSQQSQPAIEAQLDKLPPALREQGRALLNQRDDAQRARLVRDLARAHGTNVVEFLLSVLATDPAPRVRAEVIDRLSRYATPPIRQALEHHAAADPDTNVALLALNDLRELQTRELARLLGRRIEQARASGNEAELRRLGQEQERWISLVRGTMLPSFLRTPPPLFSLKESGQPVRVLAFGDFGNGSEGQKQVAAAMLKTHRQTPFDFAITLGDNFYSAGMESTADPRWKTWWDALYDPLGIKFYATLGNHDWGLADSPAAEILYTRQSPSWRMPAPYYTFTAGPVQFFALDSNEISEAQLLWLKDELAKSRARWKLVYGHH
ncbi:MAG: metallophosphoesterase, partial [Blastocatellia bacterium]